MFIEFYRGRLFFARRTYVLGVEFAGEIDSNNKRQESSIHLYTSTLIVNLLTMHIFLGSNFAKNATFISKA
jgi:hypothetical protein